MTENSFFMGTADAPHDYDCKNL